MPSRIGNYGDWLDDGRQGFHPPNCTCVACNEERLRLEASTEEERRAREYDRRVAQSRARSGARTPQDSGNSPSFGSQPPPRPPRPASGAGHGQGRPPRRPRRRRPLLAVSLWVTFLGIVAGLVAAVLYVSNPGLFGLPQDGEPSAAAPALAEEPVPTPMPTPTPEPALGPADAKTVQPTVAAATTTPEPVATTYEWQLDCPGCLVVFLDAREPGAAGSAKPRTGTRLRIVGCTDTQTTLRGQYVFRSPAGEYTGVVIFGPAQYPKTADQSKCYEMLGEYRGTARYSLARYQRDHILAETNIAERTHGVTWKPIGALGKFHVTEWAVLPSADTVVAAKALSETALLQAPATAPAPAPVSAPTPTPSPAAPPATAPTNTPWPTATPTPMPTPTPTPLQEKEYLLGLINDAREEHGVSLLSLGTNTAAQQHAGAMLEGNFTGHWGLDGLKPFMRYTLAGGADYVKENANGAVVAESVNYRRRTRKAMLDELHTGLLDSPGHRKNILNKWHTAVNLGVACSEVTCSLVQNFEGDYVTFDEEPTIVNEVLSFAGELKGGFTLLSIQVWYDEPPHPLTLGQLDATYAYTIGQEPVTFLLKPAPSGFHYRPADLLPASYSWTAGTDPYTVDPNRARRAASGYGLFIPRPVVERTASVPRTIAGTWRVSGPAFEITANLSTVIDRWGPGVYTIIMFGKNSGEAVVLTNYSIFHGVAAPSR